MFDVRRSTKYKQYSNPSPGERLQLVIDDRVSKLPAAQIREGLKDQAGLGDEPVEQARAVLDALESAPWTGGTSRPAVSCGAVAGGCSPEHLDRR
jgi:hypothetical protein